LTVKNPLVIILGAGRPFSGT